MTFKNPYFISREHCDVCLTSDKKNIFSEPFSDDRIQSFIDIYYQGQIDHDIFQGVSYELRQCQNCDFIWQAYVLNDLYMQKLYDTWISSEESLKKRKEAPLAQHSLYSSEVQEIINMVCKPPNEISILEFGMGWGYWSQMAKTFNCQVTGFEFSQTRINHAKNLGLNVISDFSQLENNHFDVIYSNQVFEHVHSFQNFMPQLIESLKTNGLIKIAVPDGRHVPKQLKNKNWKPEKGATQPLEHISCFNHNSLIRLGKQYNLKWIPKPWKLQGNNLKQIFKNCVRPLHDRTISTSLYFQKI